MISANYVLTTPTKYHTETNCTWNLVANRVLNFPNHFLILNARPHLLLKHLIKSSNVVYGRLEIIFPCRNGANNSSSIKAEPQTSNYMIAKRKSSYWVIQERSPDSRKMNLYRSRKNPAASVCFYPVK